jgi:hypothetical protein
MKDARARLTKIAAQNAAAAINLVEASLSDIKPLRPYHGVYLPEGRLHQHSRCNDEAIFMMVCYEEPDYGIMNP